MYIIHHDTLGLGGRRPSYSARMCKPGLEDVWPGLEAYLQNAFKSYEKLTTQDHAVMLICGLLLLLLGVLGFLAVCTYAVIVAPKWSRNGQHANVKAFRFLLFRFRLDSWWFGVLLLLRGPLMSLPIALATDYAPVQVMSVMLVFMVILIIQANAWPWKVPLLNVLDCFIGFCITMLVASNSLYLGGLEGSMKDFADGVGSVIMGMMGAAVTLLFVMTLCALTFRAALGGQQELIAFNLQRTCFFGAVGFLQQFSTD